MTPSTGVEAEINYVANMTSVLQVSAARVEESLTGKPFNEIRRGLYLMDMGQIFKLLPEPRRRLLDLGCGPGWTSRMFAAAQYDVLGLDVCPDMIELARKAAPAMPNLSFEVWNCESPLTFGEFDIAVMYDALHHAVNEASIIGNVYGVLREGGILVTVEPGAGHSQSEGSLRAMELFGVTEKDMPYRRQREFMLAAGFRTVRQYLRLSELPMEAVDVPEGRSLQCEHFKALDLHTAERGHTSIVVAVK